MTSERKSALLAVGAMMVVVVLDLFLPPKIETGFFFIIPLLISQRTRDIRFPWAIAGMVAFWTVGVDFLNPGGAWGRMDAYDCFNDFLSVLVIGLIAFFISSRIKAEADLNAIIDFVDGRLGLPEDNLRLRRGK